MPSHPGSEDRLKALANFLPVVSAADFTAGEMVYPPDLPSGVTRVPYSVHSEMVTRFVDMLYRENWITSFNWPQWLETRDARELFEPDGAALAKASEEQLSRVLTVCERRCRFAWGDPLLEDFESGLIARIVRRAADLAKEGNH